MPDTTCQAKSPIPATMAPMWTALAESLPFCMAGTHEAASAQSTTNPAPAYRCGPGKSFPALAYVLSGPFEIRAIAIYEE